VNPTELSLFSDKEQTLLVATEPARLAEMDEDELDQLLSLVRRARNKYSKLHRRQGAAQVEIAGKRSATGTSNQRTIRKAEIFEDALYRVSRALSAAARRSRDDLKRERIELARASSGVPGRHSTGTSPESAGSGRSTGAPSTTRTGTGTGRKGTVTERRAASTRASNARSQARRDRPR
jgi:hypothetical protein